MKQKIKNYIQYRIPFIFREFINTIRAFFNPRQKWLTNKIPYYWIDKDRLWEICILEGIKHYVEEEKALEFLCNDNPPEQAKFVAEVKYHYDVITRILPELEEQLNIAWKNVPNRSLKDINNSKPGDYERIYGGINKLEKEIFDLKTETMIWAIKKRDHIWT